MPARKTNHSLTLGSAQRARLEGSIESARASWFETHRYAMLLTMRGKADGGRKTGSCFDVINRRISFS
jgi:hypothetical protein